MNDKTPKILEHVRNKIENSDDNIKHIIEQQGNNYVLFWKKTVRGIGLLSLIVLVVGICQTATMLFVAPTPEALQSSTSLLAAQTTDMPVTDTPILHHHDNKPATITDNEIKNSADHTTNKHNQTRYAENKPAIPQPDIIATAPIEQEHIPVLLAENETQIEIEQNLAADTAYMIADAGEVYDELEMYCSTRCSSNEVIVSLDRLMENTDIM